MTENKIFIHIKMGNLYYDKMNTNEALHNFFMSQQDEKKKLINAPFCYGGDFRNYLKKFLMGVDSETDDKFDMLTNKIIKYLFYQHIDFLLLKNLPTVLIRDRKIVDDYIAIEEIQNRNWQYLIESLISRVEDENQEFRLKANKDSNLLKKKEKNCRVARCVYNSIYQSVADIFLLYVNSLDFDETN